MKMEMEMEMKMGRGGMEIGGVKPRVQGRQERERGRPRQARTENKIRVERVGSKQGGERRVKLTER